MIYLLTFVTAFFITLFTKPYVKKLAFKMGEVDHPK